MSKTMLYGQDDLFSIRGSQRNLPLLDSCKGLLNNDVVFGCLSLDGKQVQVTLDIHACDLDNVYHLRDTLEEFVRAVAEDNLPVHEIIFGGADSVLYSASAALQHVGAVLAVRSGDEAEPDPTP